MSALSFVAGFVLGAVAVVVIALAIAAAYEADR